jgi:hypothetical protein
VWLDHPEIDADSMNRVCSRVRQPEPGKVTRVVKVAVS